MKTRITLLLAVALVAGCGGGGDDDKDEGEGGTTNAPSADVAVFDTSHVGFTFEYPREYTAVKRPEGEVLGQVTIERGVPLNALKIRKTADQELGTERYLDEFQRDFARTVGKVDKREETVGDLEMGVLEFEDTVEQLGVPVKFTSTSYFFKGGGKTWQVECIADAEHRASIADACMQALETIDFKA